MIVIEESITINRPRQEVWEYVTDPANEPVWQSGVIEFEANYKPGNPEVGDTFRESEKFLGRHLEMTGKVTQVEPGKRFGAEIVEGPFPGEYYIDLDDVDGGTGVNLHAEIPGFRGFFGKITDPVVAKILIGEIRSDLETLKTLLEEA
jgi:uncharacterized protein YndB with AHSA1/START domain